VNQFVGHRENRKLVRHRYQVGEWHKDQVPTVVDARKTAIAEQDNPGVVTILEERAFVAAGGRDSPSPVRFELQPILTGHSIPCFLKKCREPLDALLRELDHSPGQSPHSPDRQPVLPTETACIAGGWPTDESIEINEILNEGETTDAVFADVSVFFQESTNPSCGGVLKSLPHLIDCRVMIDKKTGNAVVEAIENDDPPEEF
jgi:hypothetical protein